MSESTVIVTGAGSQPLSTSTVDDLINRALRDWLDPADEQPLRITTEEAISTTATSLTVDLSPLDPDELAMIAPGVIIEFGLEHVRVTAVDESTGELTIVRGVNGTTAATIATGLDGTVAPTWPRKVLFDAVVEAVIGLWPDLYRVKSSETFTVGDPTTEVDEDVEQVIRLLVKSGDDWYDAAAELLDPWPQSSTGKAIRTNAASGRTGQLVYKARFAAPTSASTALSELGVERQWDQFLVVSTVVHATAGRDLDHMTEQFLSQTVESQGFPVRSAGSVRDGLIRLEQYLRNRAMRSQRARTPTPVVYHSVL